MKLIERKFESFELTKKLNKGKIIKKTYKPRLKKYLEIIKIIKLIRRYIIFLKIKLKVENFSKNCEIYMFKLNILRQN